MKVIKKPNITIRNLFAGYQDLTEEGVVGYSRNLDIRPPYQREFVYKDAQQKAVIHSVLGDMPLGVMYWARKDSNSPPMYEVIDGQQRIISICRYLDGAFSVDHKFFHNHPKDVQEQILDYELLVYKCKGTAAERLQWFEVINLPGEKLTKQELRNAVYSGPWLSNAKEKFSKSKCPAAEVGKGLISGRAIRQDFLEAVLTWVSDKKIEDYMATHQQDADAKELWDYFENVMAWVKNLFGDLEKGMEKVPWGLLYNQHQGSLNFDIAGLRDEVQRLRQDEDVTNTAGIYTYALNREEKVLNVRAFNEKQKRIAFANQQGTCPKCEPGKTYAITEMEADHITPWSQGGKTEQSNCQMLCKKHNREKSNI